ncbi:uncharacterized protein MELLADRAFT_58558 [Melampsora larici-populina 98AG31]|uniref:Uncharacterized protein n=1 Tax=Melampsora larici-populina (strain 98AG31 / pathotype 3-4-7) TaxID=747676 RepID=F4R3Y8_MELLP|nr:uncharacterized protein MELLADRAFT_58558 [Melampsora larici-populina 98AG31]EGG13080.1 hypothetical protein MELLADRAFT_58558 [Melampsora larici-populina 98AG31]
MADWNPPPHPRSRNEPERYGNLQSTSVSRPGTDGPRSKIGSRAGSTASSKQRVNEGRGKLSITTEALQKDSTNLPLTTEVGKVQLSVSGPSSSVDDPNIQSESGQTGSSAAEDGHEPPAELPSEVTPRAFGPIVQPQLSELKPAGLSGLLPGPSGSRPSADSFEQGSLKEFLKVFNGNLEVLDSNIRDFSNELGSKFSEVLKKEFHLLEVVNAQYKELYKVIRQDNKDVSSLNKKFVSFLNQFPSESLNLFLDKNSSSLLSLNDINENILEFKNTLNEFCDNHESERPSVVQHDQVLTTLLENLHHKLYEKLDNKFHQNTSLSSDEMNKFIQDQTLAVENEKIQRSNFQDFIARSLQEIKENQTKFENSTNSKLDRIEDMLLRMTNSNKQDIEQVQEQLQNNTLPTNRVGSMVRNFEGISQTPMQGSSTRKAR